MCQRVVSSYRRDDFADAEGFGLQLGMVLERYSDSIINFATNPVTGIQRVSKWPPSIAEVVTHCDDEVARLAKIKRYKAMGEVQRLPAPPRHRGNVYVPPDNVLFPKMVDRARTATALDTRYDERGGLWVPLGWMDDDKPVGETKRFTADDLRRIYAQHDEVKVA